MMNTQPSFSLRGAIAAVTLAVLVGLLAVPASGRADTFGNDVVASASGNVLAADAYQPVVNENGGEVVWVGILRGVQGIWETDQASGNVTLVAGDTGDSATTATDVGSPSVSADGVYVAFTTDSALDPVDDPGQGCSSVYVRNMHIPIGQPGAYTLVSALNGSTLGLTYAGTNEGDTKCDGGGSASAAKTAISSDGNRVAFTVLGASDLTTGLPTETTTPPDQVAVRTLSTDTTTLVSQTMASEQAGAPEPVDGGAALTNVSATAQADATSASLTTGPALVNGASVTVPLEASTASISADGTTVAWMGINIPSQAPTAGGATGPDAAPTGDPSGFDEPLWRYIAGGPTAPTERVTGGDDPASGGQGPLDEYPTGTSDSPTGPAQGTFISPNGVGTFDKPTINYNGAFPLDEATPQLSANGQEVAFLADAYAYNDLPNTLTANPYGLLDAYLVNMANGLTRDAAITRLSEVSTYPVEDLAISPDGTKVAFTTADIAFPLASPALVTPSLTQVDGAQLYEVDLTQGTVSLVSYGYDGNPADGDVLAPSFTGDDDTLAFATSADNLVYGAYNGTTSNNPASTLVFTTQATVTPTVSGATSIGAGFVPLSLDSLWSLSATAGATSTGDAVVRADLPGSGTLKAVATALIASTRKVTREETVKVKVRVKLSPRRAGAKTGVRTVIRKERKRVTVTERIDHTKTLVSGQTTAAGAGDDSLRLTPAKAYDADLEASRGLYTTIKLTFSSHGHPTLTQTLQLTLHRKPPRPAKGATKKKVTRR
jgi:Tol biopolymer transport system component